MRKLVTLCFRHSVHAEELLQLELLYWGGKGRRRGGGGEGEGRGREDGGKGFHNGPTYSPPLPSLAVFPTFMMSMASLRRHTRTCTMLTMAMRPMMKNR